MDSLTSTTDFTIQIRRLGRVIAVAPATVCKRFESYCTINASIREQASADNGWQTAYSVQPEPTYWYDIEPKTGTEFFVCFSGYLEFIQTSLEASYPGRVQVRDMLKSRLSDPDIELLKSVSWRPGQVPVVSAILARHGGQVICDVGFGKTFICTQLARAYPQAKIVFTVPYKRVAIDAYKSLKEHIPDVGMVGGGRRQPRRVTVAVSKSLHHAPADADLVLVDEAHAVLTPDYIRVLNRFERAKLFAFTASPEGRGDNRDGYLEAIFGPKLCDVTYQQNVELGNVVPLRAVVYEVRNGPDVTGISDDVRRMRRGIWRNATRNAAIAAAVQEQIRERGPETQILVMTERTEHALLLHRLLPGFRVVHGEVSPEDRRRLIREGIINEDTPLCTPAEEEQCRQDFANLAVHHVISTSVWSVGVNFWDLEVFVRAEGSPSQINGGQLPGRLSRLAKKSDKKVGIIIDFTDRFSKVLYGRWEKRRALYAKKGWPIEFRELPDEL